MLGRLALKLKELADAELQYECHKNGNSALTTDLMKLRDGLEREVVSLVFKTTDEIEKKKLYGKEALSYIYSNREYKEETTDAK